MWQKLKSLASHLEGGGVKKGMVGMLVGILKGKLFGMLNGKLGMLICGKFGILMGCVGLGNEGICVLGNGGSVVG